MSTDKNIIVDIWLVSLLTSRLVGDLIEESPLSTDEFAIYGLISDLGPVTAADLARGTGMSPTTLSGILRRCEQRGELTRVENPGDRRSSFLRLTEHGVEVYSDVVPPLVDAILQLIDHLGGHHDDVRVALQVLDEGLRRQLGVERRPYVFEGTRTKHATLDYSGPSLSTTQAREVGRYIDWIRTRDAELD